VAVVPDPSSARRRCRRRFRLDLPHAALEVHVMDVLVAGFLGLDDDLVLGNGRDALSGMILPVLSTSPRRGCRRRSCRPRSTRLP
jgi:hypothetical protein